MNKMDWLTEDLNLSHNQFYVQRRKALKHQYPPDNCPDGNIDSVVPSGCNHERGGPLFPSGQILTRRLPAEHLHPPLPPPLDTSYHALNRGIRI